MQSAAPHREAELLVRFRPGVSQQDKESILAAHGGRKKKDLSAESGVEKLELVNGGDEQTVALQMLLEPQVEFAEPNFLIAKDDVIPNDVQFNEQWSLRNTGQNGGQFGSDISAAGAWTTTTGSPSTVIAIVDSGIDFTHPDLVNNEWLNPAPSASGDVHGWDFVANSADIKDEQGHGTAVAGIIAAEGNNSLGTSGVMWRANLIGLRVLDGTGTGDVGNAIEAIDYAVAHGAQVINLSWGTSGNSLALRDALDRAMRRNVVVVCSAGNSGRDLADIPYYPASYGLRNLISVAASDSFDQLASWSNWGRQDVTIAAPGTNILTTRMNGGYWNVSGTSAAAPIVTGIAGLLKTFRPYANAEAVTRAISDGVRKTSSLYEKVATGGVANAEGALARLRSPQRQSLPFPVPGFGSGGTGPGGSFSVAPPAATFGAPGVNLPNLDELRNAKPQAPRAKAPIESNLPCADCDPSGGGGGGSYYPPNDPNFSTARSKPSNDTGDDGVDLGSRNFNWRMPLLYLPGRAGFDLNLTLTYNSLVWTKDGSYMKFNADLGSPAPGFRLGLPTLQQKFLDSQATIWAYMMVTASGARVELRQVGTSTIYESQDSNYTQLDASNVSSIIVRTTDGTKFTFEPAGINNEYRCREIKDRNGNYITATYNPTNGHLETITDTLGRVVTFAYDLDSNLSAIQQTWGGVTHNWATFNYGQAYVAPGFGGGLLVNGPNGNNVTVLSQVNLHDGSYFTFDYNTAFAQVNKISRHASDGRVIAYTSYNVSSASGQTDCPRFTEQHDWAENWNNHNEVITYYNAASDGSSTQQTLSDGTIYKEFFYTSGWQTGLTYLAEFWSGNVRKKWTTIAWTQDDTTLAYRKNPRPNDTSVYDEANNRRRTEIIYTTFNLPNPVALPTEVKEYAADATTVLRRTTTMYLNQDRDYAAYIDRRVLGLVREVVVYDGNNQPFSRVWFDYDWNNADDWVATPQPATQHDASGVATGRGNVVWIGRWDVSDFNNSSKVTTQLFRYNRTGSLIRTEDHNGHSNTISYTDSFSDGVSRTTFAYPTTVTDADAYSSSVQYNYDFGAVTRTQDPKGAVYTMTYDAAARRDRITNHFTGAYTRWVYPTGTTFIASYSTIQAGQGEAFEGTAFDGAGRYRSTQVDLPGSVGGYSVVTTGYDVMGRPKDRSNPTEINSSWLPAGDDASTGTIWTSQTYDWKGRPTTTTNPDGSTRENSYAGCGCAGGEVTTVRDERGRRRKLTTDVFGRLKQVDELNWDQSVYATTTYTYNARDQITQINQGGQIRSFEYDGYGRLQRRTTPEQGATNYSYFADDLVQAVTDARGATTTFGYNNRHLVTSLTYGVPSGVAPTANVSFGYDSAGNRTSMTDGLGSASYSYDTMSRLTSESRTFTGVGTFAFTYGYNLGNELTSITNQWGAQVGYVYDKIGRPTSVSGSGYAGVTSYVNSFAYRAFGLKQMNYSNGRTLSVQYDNRMRPTRWDIPGVMGWNYAYTYFNENTGRITYAQNIYDNTLDRSYDYDNVGRLIEARTGSEARGHLIGQGGTQDGPYAHSYRYDQMGNMSYRVGWGGWFNPWLEQWPSYTNNRLTTNPWTGATMTYDVAGNLTYDGYQTYTYDATGQQTYASATGLTQSYDGDGLRAKKVESGVSTYYLRSSVLGGQVISEINGSGTLQRGYVYLGGQMLAIQQSNAVSWVHQDPVTKSQRVTNSSGTVTSTVDLDPWGGETSRSSNQAFQPHRYTTYERDANGSDEAMMRRYAGKWHRFTQPDPYDSSYELTDPQSFNRYAYVQNDPVSFVDPTGLDPAGVLGGWIGITLNPPSGSVTVYGSFNNSGAGFFGGDHTGILIADPYAGGETSGGGGEMIPARNLMAEVYHLLDNNRCFTFISDLINVARQLTGRRPYTYDGYELARKIATQTDGGISFYPGAGGGDASGDIFSGTARVGIFLFPSGAGRDPIGAQVSYALVALHEFIHLAAGADQYGAGIYSDYLLAEAARILTGAPGYPSGPAPRTEEEQNKLRDDTGTYWDRQLREHCSPTGG